MPIVEAYLLDDQEAEEMPESGGKRGQLIAHLTAPPLQQGVSHQVKGQPNHRGVQKAKLQSLLVLDPADLVE